jgi:hypothetical protein
MALMGQKIRPRTGTASVSRPSIGSPPVFVSCESNHRDQRLTVVYPFGRNSKEANKTAGDTMLDYKPLFLNGNPTYRENHLFDSAYFERYFSNYILLLARVYAFICIVSILIFGAYLYLSYGLKIWAFILSIVIGGIIISPLLYIGMLPRPRLAVFKDGLALVTAKQWEYFPLEDLVYLDFRGHDLSLKTTNHAPRPILGNLEPEARKNLIELFRMAMRQYPPLAQVQLLTNESEERILYTARTHWIVYKWAALLACINILMLFGILSNHNQVDASGKQSAVFLLIFLILATVIVFSIAYVRRQLNVIRVSDIQMTARAGMFNRTRFHILLNNIESVFAERSRLRLFDTGAVIIKGLGGTSFKMNNVDKPDLLINYISRISRSQ